MYFQILRNASIKISFNLLLRLPLIIIIIICRMNMELFNWWSSGSDLQKLRPFKFITYASDFHSNNPKHYNKRIFVFLKLNNNFFPIINHKVWLYFDKWKLIIKIIWLANLETCFRPFWWLMDCVLQFLDFFIRFTLRFWLNHFYIY